VLVLTRRIDESIIVGNEITITVLEVRGDQVRIGIQAPRSVQVHREEVFRQIEEENAQAARSAGRALAAVARMPGGSRKPPPIRPRRDDTSAPTPPSGDDGPADPASH